MVYFQACLPHSTVNDFRTPPPAADLATLCEIFKDTLFSRPLPATYKKTVTITKKKKSMIMPDAWRPLEVCHEHL